MYKSVIWQSEKNFGEKFLTLKMACKIQKCQKSEKKLSFFLKMAWNMKKCQKSKSGKNYNFHIFWKQMLFKISWAAHKNMIPGGVMCDSDKVDEIVSHWHF